jgi:NitT/TauT family transport system substrate-binding protein
VRRVRRLLLAALLLAAPAARAAERVTFNMSWLPQGSMSGVIVAIEKGWYAEAGLDVNVVRGFGAIRTANELDQGLFEFGYADPLAVILNRANGGHARFIGAINARLPAGLCFVEQRGKLTKPADLVGKTVGGGQNSPMQALVPPWLKRNGVEPGQLKMLQLDPSVVVTSLIEGKVDAAECWLGNSMPLFRQRAAQAGVTVGWLPYASFGLGIYGNGLITSDKILAEKPETVRAFLAATYRGYRHAASHAEEATAIMLKRFPVLDATITRQQIEETAELLDKGTAPLDRDRIAQSIELLAQTTTLKNPVAVDDVYTDRFLPAP